MYKNILFIDRDGTLVNEPKVDKQLDSLEKLFFEPMVIPSLLALKAKGYEFVMVSNQDGLGTNSFPKKSFDLPHDKMLSIFASQGITFSDTLICPHFPKDDCECRKPKLGLMKKYLTKGKYKFENCYVIGDRKTDIELAKALGITGILYGKLNNWENIADQLTCVKRTSNVNRVTKETSIDAFVDLDSSINNNINTGLGFFDHMLDQIATHGDFHLSLQVKGDLHVDEHHTIEDVALVVGKALHDALGDKLGIARFGFALPMDEAKASCLLDLSGRPFCDCSIKFKRDKIGDFPTEMTSHFFRSLADGLKCTLHLKAKGKNDHHQIESLFKVFGRTFRQAKKIENSKLPSSKGVL